MVSCHPGRDINPECVRCPPGPVHTTLKDKRMEQMDTRQERLFIGVYPCGIAYADRHYERNGDYARLAFLSYDTLELEIEESCPSDLRKRITDDAAVLLAKQGHQYRTSTAGQDLRWNTIGVVSQPCLHHAQESVAPPRQISPVF